MTNEEKVQYWVDLSDYDLETAEAMFQCKRYLYVGFMCHQAIEKIFKGYYSKLKEEMPPFTHGLLYLAEKGGFWELFTEEQKKYITTIEPLNIKSRYPDYKNELVKKITPAICIEYIEQTKKLPQWIKEKL
jgi:HEPN domain-containing protein